ncbi:MAG TPA: sigma-70 family RNA polymerase sigma factor [Solirubrobacteraceae bacterium]|nr:sigma-70 family RNA polymerase sigma factor [Solirubrobacteraceae bacterium]
MARSPDHTDERAALVRLVRDEGARVLATLVRTTGSWQLAEDAVQDAVMRALDRWPRDGIPPEPRAWLTVTARRRAIDLIRREAMRDSKELAALELRVADAEPPDHGVVRDDLLRLLFVCCHPALSVEAQTALALRTLGGLSTEEVASSLLVSPATMAKRLTRAKRKIQVARIPYEAPSPEDLPERLQGVLTVIYLMFTEGYHASGGDGPLRRGLTSEAIRLATLLRELLPGQVSVLGLAALLALHDARTPARLDHDGEPVRLAEQDRSRWDRDAIERGLALLGLALRGSVARPDPFVVQAAIAACHDLAPTWEATNWPAIVSWYDVLLTVGDTPVVRLGRAVAIGELHGPDAGLTALETVEGLEGHLPFVAGRAELLARSGRVAEARDAYRAALELPTNAATRRTLAARLDELG